MLAGVPPTAYDDPAMRDQRMSAFAVRLRDLLSTLETAALLGAAEARVRGLGEQLQFACLALPCSEALVALELSQLGRLRVPGVATAEQWRSVELEFLPSGTPFAFLLGGGAGYAAELEPDDAMIEVLRPVLETEPRQALFVPIRIGSEVIGGAALLREEGDMREDALHMAERLAGVLALTLESFRTERVLLELFAQVLPELCHPDAATDFSAALREHIHALRLAPAYRRRMQLTEMVGRVAALGPAEAELAADILGRFEKYMAGLVEGDGAEPYAALTDEELLS